MLSDCMQVMRFSSSDHNWKLIRQLQIEISLQVWKKLVLPEWKDLSISAIVAACVNFSTNQAFSSVHYQKAYNSTSVRNRHRSVHIRKLCRRVAKRNGEIVENVIGKIGGKNKHHYGKKVETITVLTMLRDLGYGSRLKTRSDLSLQNFI